MSEIALVAQPDTAALEQQVNPIVAQATAFAITSAATYEDGGAFLKRVAVAKRTVTEFFDPLVKRAHELHKSLTAARGRLTGPLELAEGTVKRRMADYQQEQERIRRAEELRLQEIARAAEQKRRDAEVEALAQQGRDQEALELIDAPIPVAPIALPAATPKVQGVSTRKVWRFEVVNSLLIPREFLIVSEQLIRQRVNALGDRANIPGVRVWADSQVAVRA